MSERSYTNKYPSKIGSRGKNKNIKIGLQIFEKNFRFYGRLHPLEMGVYILKPQCSNPGIAGSLMTVD